MGGFVNETVNSNTPKTLFTAKETQINVFDDMVVVAFKMKGTRGEAVKYYYNSGTFLKRHGKW